MMDEECEELGRNGAEEVLTSTRFIETQKLEQRNSLGAFEEPLLETKSQSTHDSRKGRRGQATNVKFSNSLSSANLHLNAV